MSNETAVCTSLLNIIQRRRRRLLIIFFLWKRFSHIIIILTYIPRCSCNKIKYNTRVPILQHTLMMTTVYYEFWPTIRFRLLHNAIKMRASQRRRRLFLAANSGFWHYQNTRARDLATYQTVFSNGSCRNLIKVIRLIPRNNINSLFLSRSSVFFSMHRVFLSLTN